MITPCAVLLLASFGVYAEGRCSISAEIAQSDWFTCLPKEPDDDCPNDFIKVPDPNSQYFCSEGDVCCLTTPTIQLKVVDTPCLDKPCEDKSTNKKLKKTRGGSIFSALIKAEGIYQSRRHS